jgi:hypothetical protein
MVVRRHLSPFTPSLCLRRGDRGCGHPEAPCRLCVSR